MPRVLDPDHEHLGRHGSEEQLEQSEEAHQVDIGKQDHLPMM